jgi:phosphotransferase system HPr (HPr) family protein
MPENCEESVVLPVALHARPAGALVRAVAPFDARVEVHYGQKSADARSILVVLGLGAPAGSTVVIRGEGPEADAAVKAAVEVLRSAD